MAIDPKRVKEIFLKAADLSDEAARAAYLDRACRADAGVRERVEALLRSHDPEGSFLGTPAAVVPDPDPAATQSLTGNADAGVEAAQSPPAKTALPTTSRWRSCPLPPAPMLSAGSGITRCCKCSAAVDSASSSGHSTRCCSGWLL